MIWRGSVKAEGKSYARPGLRECSTFCQLRVVQSGLHVKYKGVVNFFEMLMCQNDMFWYFEK